MTDQDTREISKELGAAAQQINLSRVCGKVLFWVGAVVAAAGIIGAIVSAARSPDPAEHNVWAIIAGVGILLITVGLIIHAVHTRYTGAMLEQAVWHRQEMTALADIGKGVLGVSGQAFAVINAIAELDKQLTETLGQVRAAGDRYAEGYTDAMEAVAHIQDGTGEAANLAVAALRRELHERLEGIRQRMPEMIDGALKAEHAKGYVAGVEQRLNGSQSPGLHLVEDPQEA